MDGSRNSRLSYISEVLDRLEQNENKIRQGYQGLKGVRLDEKRIFVKQTLDVHGNNDLSNRVRGLFGNPTKEEGLGIIERLKEAKSVYASNLDYANSTYKVTNNLHSEVGDSELWKNKGEPDSISFSNYQKELHAVSENKRKASSAFSDNHCDEPFNKKISKFSPEDHGFTWEDHEDVLGSKLDKLNDLISDLELGNETFRHLYGLTTEFIRLFL